MNLFAVLTVKNPNLILKKLIRDDFKYTHLWINGERASASSFMVKISDFNIAVGLQTDNEIINYLNNNISTITPAVLYGELRTDLTESSLSEISTSIRKCLENYVYDDNYLRENLSVFFTKFIAVTTVNNKVKIIGDHLGHYPLTYYSTPDFKIYSNVKKNIWRIGASPLTELDYYPKPVIPSSTIEKIADAQSIIIRLEKLLTESILKRIPGNNRIGIMFSGGLDSLLLSKLIMKINESFNNEIILITAGLKDSKDIRNVRAARKLINLPVKEVLFNVEDCARILPEILLTIERYDTLNVSLAIPEYFAFNEAKENGLKIIFTGQGADEIFYGYHKYTEAFRKGLLVRELSDQDIFSLSNRNLEREMKLAFKFNLEIKYPYLDPAVVSYVRSIPDAYKLKLVGNSLISKYVLRILGEKLGIPENIFAGKVAMQYGSGAMKALKKISSNTLKDSMIQYKITEFLKRLYLRVISERGVIGKNTPVL